MKETIVTTDLATEPVTLTEVKAHLIIDESYTADDTLLTAYIKASRQSLEKYTNLSFGAKTLQCYTDCNELILFYGPNQVITSITDFNDISLVVGTGYRFNKSKEALMVEINGGTSPYTITYTAGWAPLPEALKLAIKEQVKYFYNSRGEGGTDICLSAKILSDQYSKNLYF